MDELMVNDPSQCVGWGGVVAVIDEKGGASTLDKATREVRHE